MMKLYSFWLKIAAVLQLATGFIHMLSFLNNKVPKNESEKILFNLMATCRFDMGVGFHPSTNDIMNAFSIAFALLLFFAGLINIFLVKKNLPLDVMRGVVLINLMIFLLCFIVMSFLTFLPPVVCTAMICVALIMAYGLLRRSVGKMAVS